MLNMAFTLIMLFVGLGLPDDGNFSAASESISMRMHLGHDGGVIHRTTGGTVRFRLTIADPQIVGARYLIMGCYRGTSPGFSLPGGVNMPLNTDWVTDNILYFTLTNQHFHNFVGRVPGCCAVDAVLNCPPLTCCDIDTVYFAACACFNGKWGASNAVSISIVYK